MNNILEYENLRPEQAAAFVKRSVKTLANYRSKGGGPKFSRVGNRITYRLDDLRAWLNSGHRTSTSVAMHEAAAA